MASSVKSDEFIVVAEDSAPNRTILVLLLKKLGFGVLECEDGSLAWQAMEKKTFEDYGIWHPTVKMYNCGVFLMNPKMHGAALREAYQYDYESKLYEQPFLSSIISRYGLACEISPRFNWGFFETIVLYFPDVNGKPLTPEMIGRMLPFIQQELDMAYFLHFYGCSSVMQALHWTGPAD
jgi:CheY-like chemotaxis protein